MDAKLSGQITDLDASLSGLDANVRANYRFGYQSVRFGRQAVGQITDLDASLSVWTAKLSGRLSIWMPVCPVWTPNCPGRLSIWMPVCPVWTPSCRADYRFGCQSVRFGRQAVRADYRFGCQSVGTYGRNSTALINVKIENDVTKRIELLSDGFKLSYEKQLETEKRICELERKVEKLEIKVG